MVLKKGIAFFKRSSQTIITAYFLINVAVWIGWSVFQMINEKKLDLNEFSFIIQNCVLLVVIFLRKPHRGIDPKVFNQVVALAAFCSGAALIGQPVSLNPILKTISTTIMVCSNVLGIFTLLNLGRSFGVLIAIREVKTNGLYSFVRHPMYGTDILLRTGYIIGHFNLISLFVYVASTFFYIYRALLEERFLSQDTSYREYKDRVRYRFIPGVF